MKEKERIVRSTPAEIEAFKKSPLWLDMLDELNLNIESHEYNKSNIATNALKNNASTACVLLTLGEIDGWIKCLSFVSNHLLEVISSEWKIQHNQSMEIPDEANNDNALPDTPF